MDLFIVHLQYLGVFALLSIPIISMVVGLHRRDKEQEAHIPRSRMVEFSVVGMYGGLLLQTYLFQQLFHPRIIIVRRALFLLSFIFLVFSLWKFSKRRSLLTLIIGVIGIYLWLNIQ
ncbi:hypothetical protein Q73_06270 [Bacillus coahuilensis m2-6]|uniref:hypothetical protein n=1 Tax=Bacillus coahuilensis TaxID=408580 RepID=UPI000750307A|nr:hypothetical protein [Bacillus coahuilensis]KUP08348.1 hypothetical protein Q73_06270 [Bacillus coahuilensis m2-6]